MAEQKAPKNTGTGKTAKDGNGAPDMPWLANYPEGVDWDARIPAEPLYALLDRGVETYPDHIALDFLGKTYDYKELGEIVRRTARGLQDLGVRKGLHVGLFLPNCPYYPFFYFGVLKAGGTVVNVNPLYADKELRHMIEDAEIDIMVALDLNALYGKLAALLDSTRLKQIIVCKMADILPFPKNLLFPIAKGKDIADIPDDAAHVRFAEVVDNDGTYKPVNIDPAKDIALLQYTGGTTGVPKGAMLTHKNVYSNCIQCRMWFERFEDGKETALAVLPFFHVFAMTTIMNFGLYTGARIVMLPRYERVEMLKTITKKKPTSFNAVPTLYTAINNSEDIAEYDLSSLRFCISGGAALPVEVKRRFEELSGATLVEGYGLSEASPVVCSNPPDGLNKAGSIGMPYPQTMVSIVSIDDGKTVLPLGETGEICVQGPQVMAGYWKRPDATAETLRNNRLHTGDVGYIDEDGYVFIVDRLKEVVIAGGYKIYPRNVEEAIYEHEAVAETAVVGIPDEYRGQTVKAYIVLKPGKSVTEQELETFLAERISRIEEPKIYEFRDELPKSQIGKIMKKELLAEEAAKAGKTT